MVKSSALRKLENQKALDCNIDADLSLRGSNWIHTALEVKKSKTSNFGVFSTDFIDSKTPVIVYGGKIITSSEYLMLEEELQNYPYQIDEDLFMSPHDLSDIGIGERVNHSCSPNLGFDGSIHLITLRNILKGEELTIDYATCFSSTSVNYTINCMCGSLNCRKIITVDDWKIQVIQDKLFASFQPYLQKKIQNLRCSF